MQICFAPTLKLCLEGELVEEENIILLLLIVCD